MADIATMGGIDYDEDLLTVLEDVTHNVGFQSCHALKLPLLSVSRSRKKLVNQVLDQLRGNIGHAMNREPLTAEIR